MKILVLDDDEIGEVKNILRAAQLSTSEATIEFAKVAPTGVLEVWKRSQKLRQAVLNQLDAPIPTPPMTPQVAAYLKVNLRALRDLRGLDFEVAKFKFKEDLSVFGLTVLSDESGDYYGVGIEEG